MRALSVLLHLLASSASAGTVRLSTSDGISLGAEDWGSGAKGVLLVHDDGRTLQDWTTLAPKLASNGFRVLALDLRGHGASAPAGKPADADYPKLTADVAAGVAWLKSKGATEIHVVGAALGANLALNVAAQEPAIADLVLLSPQLNAKGLKVSGPIAEYGERSLLVVASQDDALSAKAAGYLDQSAKGPKHLQLYPSAGSGARMLNSAPDLENLVVSWLNRTFLAAADPGNANAAELKSGDIDDIETKGTRLEDRTR
jgi:alpha-beta hydrolase superfamily lysophospholipase